MKAPAATLFALLLAGCGFHLAGNRPLPAELKSVYIDVVAPYRVSEPPLETSLRNILLRRGGRVAGNPDDASTIIRLSELSETRSVLSIGADGKALEYQLVTSVHYLVTSGGKALLPPDTLSASRDYSFNAQQVLAKEAEDSRLRDYIQNELAELLLLRLEAQFAHLQPETVQELPANATPDPVQVKSVDEPATSPGAPPAP